VRVVATAVVNGITGKQTIDSFELGGIPTLGPAWP
jgi:hypothetical protein